MSDTQKILIVEDNNFVRMQLVKFLSEEGYDIIESTDGKDALEKMNDDIAIAIVDVRMEPIDGFEFVRTLRGKDIETPVMLVTGDQNPDLLEKATSHGVRTVLMKPVQKDRLVSMVSRTLQKGS